MEVQSHMYDASLIQTQFKRFSIIGNYYNEQLFAGSLSNIQEMLYSSFQEQLQNQNVRIGLDLISNVSEEEFRESKYDFMKLFVGPNQLLAPPYASIYMTDDRVLMQQEMNIVRNFYKRAGVEVQEKDQMPDDFIGLELEFICFLLSQLSKEEIGEQAELINLFLQTHFLKWVPGHCRDIIVKCETTFCKGMAYLLLGLVEEVKQIEM